MKGIVAILQAPLARACQVQANAEPMNPARAALRGTQWTAVEEGECERSHAPCWSIALREGFSWERTQALPELNAEGLPALYSVLVYLEEREQLEALDLLHVHHDALPLFAEELAPWAGQRGFLPQTGDGQGLFRYALMPGRIYNLLRQAALEGKVAYRAIVLRDVPEAARGADGSVSYAALRASGFRYRDMEPPSETQEGPRTRKQALFGLIVREVVSFIGEAAEETAILVSRGIGFVDRHVRGSVGLTVALDVRNTDPGFGGPLARDGTVGQSTPMVRAWGARAGTPVTLHNVRVLAYQLGLASSLFTAYTDSDGIARMEVSQDIPLILCLEVENDAAEVTGMLTEERLCDISLPVLTGEEDLVVQVPLRHGYFNVLAQASEGRAYLMDVVGFTPHKAEILVGTFANLWGPFSKATAPCFGFPNRQYDNMLAQLAGLADPLTRAAITTARPTYAVDIILAEDPVQLESVQGVFPGTYDRTLDSRGLTTHEYGHFALCSMLYDENPLNISIAYAKASIERLGEPGAEAQGGYINEGFADFFAGQVVGGTNYFRSEGAVRWMSTMSYCAAQFSCLDGDNATGVVSGDIKPFNAQVARIATTLHDAFDGWDVIPFASTPNSAVAWLHTDSGQAYPSGPPRFSFKGPRGDIKDEAVRLSGPALRELITRWDDASSGFLSDKTLFSSLSAEMEAAGYNWCERCQLFSRHAPGLASMPGNAAVDLCRAEPLLSWLGGEPQDANVVTLRPGPEGKDATVFQSELTSSLVPEDANFGDWPKLRLSRHSRFREESRAYIEFDLSRVPRIEGISKGTLVMNVLNPNDYSLYSTAFYLRRVTAPWDEHTLTWNNQPSVTTKGQIFEPTGPGGHTQYEADVTSMVLDMLHRPETNHGFMFQMDSGIGPASIEFASSDHLPWMRPSLRIEYRGCTW